MTYSLVQQLSGPAGTLSNLITTTGLAEVGLDAETVPVATDTLINVAFPYATVKAYFLVATVACTIETNSTSAVGGQTVTLVADVPKIWIDGGDGDNMWTADVTKFYVTAAAAGTLTLRVLYDPTP